MKLFVVAVPLFSSKMSVEAYCLCFQSGDRLLGTLDDYTSLSNAMNSPGLDLVSNVGIDPFTGGKPLFVDINQFQLLSRLPHNIWIPPHLLVCVLGPDVAEDSIFHAGIRELAEAGFPIALKGLKYSEKTDLLFTLAKYVMIDINSEDFKETLLGACTKNPDMRVVFTDIRDLPTFERIKEAPRALFQGQFYTQPITKGNREVSPLRVNALRLLKMVTEENFDLGELSDTIQRDPYTSIALLRFINSPAIGISRTVDSIRSAVALLGQKEVRKWITAAISTQLSQDKPSEITKLSLVRAKFAENLALAFEMGSRASSLFLMGLFSLLDVILDKNMSAALDEVSVDTKIREALVSRSGEFADIIELIYSYEQANWQRVAVILIRRNIQPEMVSNAFVDALVWYKDLLVKID